MKKKFILVLTFAVTFCLLFTGCGKEIKKADEKGAGKSAVNQMKNLDTRESKDKCHVF